jgi:hypothetical protein
MKSFYITFSAFFLLSCLVSCTEVPPSAKDLFPQKIDLMSVGMPIQIQAPIDAKVLDNSDSFLQDVKIKGKDYYLQIYSQTARALDCKTLATEAQRVLKTENPNFKKIIKEDPCGFVYSVQVPGDTTTCYNFAYYRIQGNNSFSFTTTNSNLIPFSLEMVQHMYLAVQAQE